MTTAAEERNGASDVTRARENPPSRKPAEHYWAPAQKLDHVRLRLGRERMERDEPLSRMGAPTHVHGKSVCHQHLEGHGRQQKDNRFGVYRTGPGQTLA